MTDETKLANLPRRYWLLEDQTNRPGISDDDVEEWHTRADVLARRIAAMPAEDMAGVAAKLRIFTSRTCALPGQLENPQSCDDALVVAAWRDAERLVEEGAS